MQPSLFEARVRNTDPGTSRAAAALQNPRGCADDILRALAGRDRAFADLTGFEIWSRFCGWREPGTVISCLSRLKQDGLVEVTGKRTPRGKRTDQATYAITEIGRASLASA